MDTNNLIKNNFYILIIFISNIYLDINEYIIYIFIINNFNGNYTTIF